MSYTEIIDRYLDGELKGKELEKFERDMLADPILAQEVEEYRQINCFIKEQHKKMAAEVDFIESADDYLDASKFDFDGIDHLDPIVDAEAREIVREHLANAGKEESEDVREFRNKVKLIHEEYIESLNEEETPLVLINDKESDKESDKDNTYSNTYSNNRKVFLAAAAAILLIIVGSAIFYLSSVTKSSPQEIYAQMYVPYDNNLIVRGDDLEDASTFNQAIEKFKNDDYNNALNLFNQIDKSNPYFLSSSFYSGIVLMETGKFNEAIKSFGFIIDDNTNDLTDKAQWYTGLCYLKLEQLDKAKEIFNELLKTESYYKEKAGEILDNLE